MFGATLFLAVVVLGSSPSSDPSTLVLQLGSPRYALRESAEAELCKLGRPALQALRLAKNSKDPEIRLRVTAILTRIEGSLLVEPTPVALDFQEVPLGQVIRQINEQAGLSLALAPGEKPGITDRRVTLRSAEPLPFWKAIDALCNAGQLHHVEGVQIGLGQREGAFLLHDGYVASSEPTTDIGPFRVNLTSVHYQSEVQLNQLRLNPAVRLIPQISQDDPGHLPTAPNKQFFVQILVSAEPRLSITQNGAIKVSTAVDNRGQSLLPRRGPGTFQHTAGYFGMNPSPLVRLRMDLIYPEGAGDRIRLIKGTIPVVVATRKSEPLEIALATSVGRSFQNEDVVLTVRDSRTAQNNQPPIVELSIRPLGAGLPPLDAGLSEPMAYRADSPQQQIEILDAEGKTLPWFPSGTFYNGEETRLTMSLISRGRTAIPAMVRYHGIIRAPSEIPFEFRDIPMP